MDVAVFSASNASAWHAIGLPGEAVCYGEARRGAARQALWAETVHLCERRAAEEFRVRSSL